MTSEQLFDDYDWYREKTVRFQSQQKQHPMRAFKRSEERLASLGEMHHWCLELKLDTRLWLYSLFQARHWTFAPNFDQLIPRTKRTEKKALERYHALQSVTLYTQRVQQQTLKKQEEEGQVYDPNRDLSGTVEGIKRRYLAAYESDRCMSEMASTLGYHPRSMVCARCPVVQACATQLQAVVPFDIVALRRGEITSDLAKRIAGRSSEHHN